VPWLGLVPGDKALNGPPVSALRVFGVDAVDDQLGDLVEGIELRGMNGGRLGLEIRG
jgi:hypothetical protein